MTDLTTDPSHLIITRLGRNGDGAADTPTGPAFVPDALPGETYAVGGDGVAQRLGAASPDRIEPPCRHFGSCGGCAVQHMGADLYRSWKNGLIRSGFQTQGIDIEQAPLFVADPHSRRRAALSAVVTANRVLLGYHARRSHTVIDLDECPVLADRITAALPALREITRQIVGAGLKQGKAIELRVEVADLSGGLDVTVSGSDAPPTMQSAAQLAILARRAGLARLTVEGLTVCSERAPQLVTEAGSIVPPPGAFFQAVEAAERHMAGLIIAGVGKAKRLADLYCGSGTFTLPLARRGRVLAVDSDKAALAALTVASRFAANLKPIQTVLRDLATEPLSPLELAGVDAVVIDPPRAGAKAQCEMIARSKIHTVVAVSCNPATLARDCRILIDAGFSMGPVHGVDQFLWSPHVEAIVTLVRKR